MLSSKSVKLHDSVNKANALIQHSYPAAAKRGLNDGHHLCVHTWSHPAMTTQTNAQVVAELYWTLKAIKEATGVTSKCWRPPQGDVDDRVRAIAHQMGLRTILWDHDTVSENIYIYINYINLLIFFHLERLGYASSWWWQLEAFESRWLFQKMDQ